MPISRLVLLPYKMASVSAKRLALQVSDLLGARVRRVRHDGLYTPHRRSLAINYGSSVWPAWVCNRFLNHPSSVALASNKLNAFQRFSEEQISCPEWTTDRDVAASWNTATNGTVVVCRTLLNSHSGRGIILWRGEGELPQAPLYVKYKKKRHEYRVHVFMGDVIDVTQKKRVARERRPDSYDGYIRNHSNGWVFARDGIVVPDDAGPLAVCACDSLGLDFGACDIVWNEHENKSYILEVNTAPGLEGTTLQRYATAVVNWVRSL